MLLLRLCSHIDCSYSLDFYSLVRSSKVQHHRCQSSIPELRILRLSMSDLICNSGGQKENADLLTDVCLACSIAWPTCSSSPWASCRALMSPSPNSSSTTSFLALWATSWQVGILRSELLQSAGHSAGFMCA